MANSTGGEIAGLWDLTRWLRLQGSYALLYLDAKRKLTSDDASTVKQLEGDSPQHRVVAQSSFTLPKAFELEKN